MFVAKDYGRKTIQKCLKDLNAAVDDGKMEFDKAEPSIELYEWILDQEDAEKKSRDYLVARYTKKSDGSLKTRQEVIDELNWKVHT